MTEPTSPIVGNSIYYNGKDGIKSEPITKVGRKYFYTNTKKYTHQRPTQWHLDTLQEVKDYGSRTTCRLSKSELEDSNESDTLIGELFEKFQYRYRIPDLTLDQLRRVKAIIMEEKA